MCAAEAHIVSPYLPQIERLETVLPDYLAGAGDRTYPLSAMRGRRMQLILLHRMQCPIDTFGIARDDG